jgi:hypothetical protein
VAWLTRDDEVLASVERQRRPARGLDTAVVLRRPTVVYALGGPGLDVARCKKIRTDAGADVIEVRRMVTLGRRRPVVPGFWSPAVIVAGAGSFERWRLRRGDQLVLTGE